MGLWFPYSSIYILVTINWRKEGFSEAAYRRWRRRRRRWNLCFQVMNLSPSSLLYLNSFSSPSWFFFYFWVVSCWIKIWMMKCWSCWLESDDECWERWVEQLWWWRLRGMQIRFRIWWHEGSILWIVLNQNEEYWRFFWLDDWDDEWIEREWLELVW